MGYVKKQKWFNGNEVLLFKPDLKSSDGKNWMAFEELSINMNNGNDPEKSRDPPVDTRAPSRIENEAINPGNIGENENSRGSRSKPRLLPYRPPEQDILLEPLEYSQNRSGNTAEDIVFANSLNPSRIPSRIPIPSRISDDNCIAGNVDQGFSVPVIEQKTLTFNQSEGDGIKSLSGSELMRADLKNFARSRYNLIVDSVPVLVGEFNKEYPGYKQKYGLQAVLYNAEKLKERGWR